jgi:hypothetical protein
MTAYPRPKPQGVNSANSPIYDGKLVRLWREGQGVTRAVVAKKLQISAIAIGMSYEAPLTAGHRRKGMEAYFAAVEKCAREVDKKRKDSRAEYLRRVAADE